VADVPASGTPLDSGGALSRRSLVVAGATGLVGLVMGGCTVNNPASGKKTPKAEPQLAPDVAVATSALAEIRAVRTAVGSTMSRFPASRARLGLLEKMHQAHEESLVDAVPDRARTTATPALYAVPRERETALRQLAKREQRLHDTLDGLALRAQSGDVARLLASMGAGIHQQLAVWS
jgi:hypothetical protein